MNLKQAHYILTIAREGGITAAARRLYVSQPSLSQMLKQVETEIGMPIFDRSASHYRLTYAGEKYVQAAEIMLSANERLENELREIREANSGRLRLGISVMRAMQVLPKVMDVFSERYPKVSIELTEEGSANLEMILEAGQIDLALAAIESTSPKLTYELIEQEVIGVLAGRDTKLAGRIPDGTPITLEEARQERFVSLKEGHSVRVVQNKLFRRFGLTPPILLETDNLEIAKRVTLQAGACMLCSNIYVDGQVAVHQGAFYPLKDYENHRHFYACYRKGEGLPAYARDFIRIVTRALNPDTGPNDIK